MADFDDPPTQEELQQMFSSPAAKGELVTTDRMPRGREVGGNELVITNIVTAHRVEVARDQPKIMQELAAIAAYAGNEVLTYRWPVKNRRTGKIDTVTGPTIKCANAIKRVYGNSYTDVLVSDQGSFWIFKAIFVDIEKGVQSARLFQQHKGVARIGGDDDARRLDMAFQIGQSKAIRNVIVDHLELPFVQHMLDVAGEKLVEKIGRNMDKARANISQRLAEADIPLIRVERVLSKVLADWTAPDIARVWQELKGVVDGMSHPADVWPIEAPPEPRRTDATVVETPSSTASDAPNGGDGGVAAPEPVRSQQPSEPAPDASATRTVASPQSWEIGDDVVGQDALIMRLTELASRATSEADIDAIEQQNAERIAKITGTRGASLRQLFRDRRIEFKGT